MSESRHNPSSEELLKRILAEEDDEGVPVEEVFDPPISIGLSDGAADTIIEAFEGDVFTDQPEADRGGARRRTRKALIRKSLGHILVDSNMITETQLADALAEQTKTKESLGVILVRKGYLKEHNIKDALELQYGVRYASIKEMTVPADVVTMVPDNVIRHHKIVPLNFKDNTMTVGMVDPTNLLALDDLRFRFKGINIEPVVITEDDFHDFLGSLHYADTHHFAPGDTQEIVEDLIETVEDRIETADYEDDVARDDAPLIRLANTIVINAIHEKASDIHIDPQEEEIKVRYRIDGMLYDKPSLPRKLLASLVSRYKIMATLDIANKRLPQDGRMRIRLRDKPIDFRVATLPARYGEKLVLRILDKSSALIGLEKLYVWPEFMERVKDMAHRPFGCIYVTGPTGSGKTTTLYSILGERNTRDVNIVTAEDPIEYDMKGVTQVQVKTDIGLTFSHILRSFLRQDPDIIMIGETRDRELAHIVVEAALTGHLVFTSLHTNDAPGAISRMLEMGIDKFLISASTVGVIAQRLVRRLCRYCRERYAPDKNLLDFLGYPYRPGERVEIYRANLSGCEECKNGYSGRIAVFEIMRFNDELRDLVGQGAPTALIRFAAKQGGMLTLKEYSMKLVQEGFTSLDEVLRVTFSDEGQEKLCPSCRNPVGEEFLKCPFCQFELRITCNGCHRIVQENWQACPTCGETIIKKSEAEYCHSCQSLLKPEWAGCPMCLIPHRKKTEDGDWDSLGQEWEMEPKPSRKVETPSVSHPPAPPEGVLPAQPDGGRVTPTPSLVGSIDLEEPIVPAASPPTAAPSPTWENFLQLDEVVDADQGPPSVSPPSPPPEPRQPIPVAASRDDDGDSDEEDLMARLRSMLDD